jgi:superfamily I DNA and/or RNA helicase
MDNFTSANETTKDAIIGKISYWKDRLYDLSGRNRLLFYKQTKTSNVEITYPSLNNLFDKLVVQGQSYIFPLPENEEKIEEGEGDPYKSIILHHYKENELGTNQSEQNLYRILYNLQSRADTAIKEKGVNILYLAFGMLNWREGIQGEFALAPLILVPVNLIRKPINQPYRISMLEEDIVVNPTLKVKLKQDFNLELPDVIEDINTTGLDDFFNQVSNLCSDFSGWQVISSVVISTFYYQNLMIIADLDRNIENYISHELIRALSIPELSISNPNIKLIEAGELDDLVSPDSVFQILDADSSQQEAIEAAKAGLNYILQGPPGTGKSQTIANIIAEFISQGKHVLFVSQKAAALKVVKKRLDEVGLGDYCLEVHSDKSDKKKVVEELGRSLYAPSAPQTQFIQQKYQELKLTREKLNAYIRALHKPRFKLEISAFKAYSELSKYDKAPRITFQLSNFQEVSIKDYQEYILKIEEISSFSKVIDQYRDHPWKGCQLENLPLDLRYEIENILISLSQDLEAFFNAVKNLASIYNISSISSLQVSIELLHIAQLYKPGVLLAPIPELIKRYEQDYHTLFRYFKRGYWKDSALLHDFSWDGIRPDYRSAIKELEYIFNLKAISKSDNVEAVNNINQSKPDLENILLLAKRITNSEEYISKIFSDDKPIALKSFYLEDINNIVIWCRQQASRINDLIEYVGFKHCKAQAESLGLASFVNKALDEGIKSYEWLDAFKLGFYSMLIDAIVQIDNSLNSFIGSTHDLIVKKFKQLDLECIKLTPIQIRAFISESKPKSSWMTSGSTEEMILRREMNKIRRLKPLRQLFKEIPELLQSLKPCFMMSPITVSQLLDPEIYKFDLVVFDEASQMPPEYAACAVIRGNQVVIAGDKYQLPPTRFFESLETDDYIDDDEENIDEFESILDECDAIGIPSKMLRWHYRSQDESLIAFSNYHFYMNRLYTFPSAKREEDDFGIEFIYIPEGVYRRGAGARNNIIEARRVVDLIIKHFHTSPDLTLGVVTFSLSQQDAIAHELDHRIRDYPDLQPLIFDNNEEQFFVKNIETVQGDERDAIFFSVGYGNDELGHFSMNFGPLNKIGGERRLNVAITRARCKVKIVSSIQPEDIDLSRTNSRGLHLLRSYMMIARDGINSLYSDITLDLSAESESPLETSVYEALHDKGLSLQKQVGVSGYRIDIGVLDPDKPGRFLLGIECDGATYHSASTARDRDRLRQQVLEKLGWRIHRIWSRDWIDNKNKEIEKVMKALENSRNCLLNNRQTTLSNEKNTNNFMNFTRTEETTDLAKIKNERRLPPEITNYKKAKIRRRGPGSESFHIANAQNIIDVLKELLDGEGPIEINWAKKRIIEAWGIQHMGKRINSRLDYVIDYAERHGALRRQKGFLWPSKTYKPNVRIPESDNEIRTVDKITVDELAEAAYLCVKSALSITEEDLIKETANLYKLRVTQDVSVIIKSAIKALLQNDRIEVRGEKIRLSHS